MSSLVSNVTSYAGTSVETTPRRLQVSDYFFNNFPAEEDTENQTESALSSEYYGGIEFLVPFPPAIDARTQTQKKTEIVSNTASDEDLDTMCLEALLDSIILDSPPPQPEAEPVDSSEAESVDSSEAEPVDSSEAESVDSSEAESVDSSEAESVDSSEAEPVESREAEPVDSSEAGPSHSSNVRSEELAQLNLECCIKASMRENNFEGESKYAPIICCWPSVFNQRRIKNESTDKDKEKSPTLCCGRKSADELHDYRVICKRNKH